MEDPTRHPTRMGPVDAMFWRLERERTLRTTTLAVALLDGPPDPSALRSALARACRRTPRLRQRVVELPAPVANPLWSPDPDFSLDYHLRWIAAPGAADEEALLDIAAAMAMQGFDRSRPLWEFVVVEGLTGGRAALVQKMHHSVGDGAAGLALIAELYDTERDAALIEEEPEPLPAAAVEESPFALVADALRERIAEGPGVARRLLDAGLEALRSPAETADRAAADLRAVGGIMRSGPGPLSEVMAGRSSRTRLARLVLPVAGLKAAGRAQGCTFNAAFLAAIVGGLRHYHARLGAELGPLRASIPISLRGEDGAVEAGNRLAIARFEVSLAEPDAGRRMRAIQARVAEQREPASLGAFEAIANLVNVSPPALILPLVLEEMRKSDFVATSLQGPPAPLYLAGSRVEALFPFGPTAGAGLNVTLLGYDGRACVGLTVDPAAVSDVDLLVDCLGRGFEEVSKLA